MRRISSIYAGHVLSVLFAAVMLYSCKKEVTKRSPNVRADFDFLIGSWEVDSVKSWQGSFAHHNDLYVFKKILNNKAIEADCYLNRATPDKPDYTRAAMYWGYDSTAAVWNYYYRSDRIAKYYQGKYIDGEWWFYSDWDVSGNKFTQRQAWRYFPPNRMERIMENTYMLNGKERWAIVHHTFFVRKE